MPAMPSRTLPDGGGVGSGGDGPDDFCGVAADAPEGTGSASTADAREGFSEDVPTIVLAASADGGGARLVKAGDEGDM